MSKEYEVERDWTTAANLRAVVVMGHIGHRCGYVGVPADHPLYGVKYSDSSDAVLPLGKGELIGGRGAIPMLCAALSGKHQSLDIVFDVHGSLTYSGGNEDDYPVPSDLWWFGFDCGHFGDAAAPGSRMANYGSNEGVHRTLEYCVDQCELLAAQMISRIKAEETTEKS